MNAITTHQRMLLVALLSLLLAAAAWGAGTIRGRVTGADGKGLPGANVRIIETGQGTVADGAGRYAIAGVEVGIYTLEASMIGYKAAVQARVSVYDGPTALDFVLKAAAVELGAMVIEASPVGDLVRQAPNKVSIIARPQIERAPALVIQDVLQTVEGLYVPRGQGPLVDFQTVVVRGMTPGAFGRNSGLLMTLNEHPLNGTLGSWANIGDLDAIPIDLIETTEVIKGPYASVYGSGATGGVLNVTTRKHFGEPVGGSVRLRAGAFGLRSIAPVVYGQKERLSYAAWGEFLHGSERVGRRRSTWNAEANGFLGEGRVEQSKFGFMLGYDLSPTDRLEVLGNRLEKYNNYDGRPIDREEIESDFINVTFTRQLGEDLRLEVLGNWLRNTYDLFADNNPVHPDSSAFLTKIQPFPNRELGLKVMLAGAAGERHRFATGVEWRRGNSSRTSWYENRAELEFDVRGQQDIYSFFLEDKISLGRLEVTPGIRLEQWKDNALYSEQDQPDGGRRVHIGYLSGVSEKEAINPKLGLAFFFSENLKLRASAGSTFRAPRVTETYSPEYQTLETLKFKANPDLKEEVIVAAEVGADYYGADGDLFLSLTAYAVDARDRIEFTLIGSFTEDDPFTIQHRNLDAEIKGLEGEASYRLSAVVGLGANFTLVSQNYKDGPFGDNETPYVPDHVVNAHIDVVPAPGIDLRLAVQRVGAMWDDVGNTRELDAYQTLALKGRWQPVDGYHLDVSLTNLLDEDYQVPSNGAWDYRPEGRALYVGLGHSF